MTYLDFLHLTSIVDRYEELGRYSLSQGDFLSRITVEREKQELEDTWDRLWGGGVKLTDVAEVVETNVSRVSG